MPLVTKENVKIIRIKLSDPEEWVDVKSRLSKGEMARIEAAGFKFSASLDEVSGKPDIDVGADYEATVFAGLEVGITQWSFPEELNAENLRHLDPDDYDIITVAVNKLWKARGVDERKNSVMLISGQSEQGSPSPKS